MLVREAAIGRQVIIIREKAISTIDGTGFIIKEDIF
jgi:hypothetical protein